jgi:hypothetical protein
MDHYERGIGKLAESEFLLRLAKAFLKPIQESIW